MDSMYYGSTLSTGEMTGILGFIAVYGMVVLITSLIISVLTVVAMWKVFEKCGKPGWASLIPIYNIWVLLEISDLPGWLCLLPVANVIAIFVSYFKLAKKFNKGVGFGFGLLFLNFIFMMILAFGKDMPNDNINAEVKSPDLMAEDPNANGNINLMMPDPIASMPEDIIEPAAPEVLEMPSLEEQISKAPEVAPIIEPIVPIMPVKEEINPNIVETNNISAFDMPIPKADNQTINPIVKEAPLVTNEVLDNTANLAPLTINQISSPESPTMELPKMTSESLEPPIIQTKKCPKCGYENASSIRACLKCGQLID